MSKSYASQKLVLIKSILFLKNLKSNNFMLKKLAQFNVVFNDYIKHTVMKIF